MFELDRSPWAGLCLIATLFAGCSTTGKVTLDSVRPAAVTFPPGVERVLIVERTDRGHKYGRIESILSGELPHEDGAATRALARELERGLNASTRFEAQVAHEKFPGLGITSALAEPLAWRKISALCSSYDADAAIVIETFDTDFTITKDKRVEEEQDEPIKYVAKGTARVTAGLRVYHPESRSIVDEKLFVRSDSWSTEGKSIRAALLALIDRGEATRHLSLQIGSVYSKRLTPTPIRITRAFRGSYKKVPAVERGTRFAEVGKWREAMAAWQAGLATADEEGAGYLTYNIAVAHEVLGDFASARSWAERSYTQFGNRDARSYVSYLDRRRDNEALANQQYE